MVNVLVNDPADSVLGLFVDQRTIENARKRSARRGVLDGSDMARIFSWMRPNDLIWNYVVSNYLLGEKPPAFDILYWNSDSTRLPAKLHSDFLDVFERNPFGEPGAFGSRRAHRPGPDQVRCLHHRRYHRPHHAVAGVLPLDPALRRSGDLRAQHRRPHPEHRQPAEGQQAQVPAQRRAARRGRGVARGSERARRFLVDSLVPVDWTAVGPRGRCPGRARQQRASGARAWAPGSYVRE